jgi:hypothetical protein
MEGEGEGEGTKGRLSRGARARIAATWALGLDGKSIRARPFFKPR